MVRKSSCQIFIGTSGWYYRDWIGSFYPEKMKSYADLSFYTQHFNTVENNSAFYHMPQPATIRKWINASPPDFIFSVKLNQQITHDHALAINPQTKDLLKRYFESVDQLKNQLGAILIQLPARFKHDIKTLERFCAYYRKYYFARTAIEFRNRFWSTQETYQLLKEHNIALTTAQSSRYPLDTTITADYAYFRFHGPEKLFMSSYSEQELQKWAAHIKSKIKKLKSVFIYFNNTSSMYAIANARRLRELIALEK